MTLVFTKGLKTETENCIFMGVITSLKMITLVPANCIQYPLTVLHCMRENVEIGTEYKIRILKIKVNTMLRLRYFALQVLS